MAMDLLDLYTRVECPYNNQHKILPLSMPYHLHKCRKNHPDVVLSVCPYNATHEVRTPELKYHMLHCPNRTLLERDFSHNALQNAILGKEEEPKKGNTDLPRPVRVPTSEDDDLENWDGDESPLVLTPQPQPIGRTQRRKQDRREIDSHLRRPQTQSMAASFTATPSPTRGGSGDRKNDTTITTTNNTNTRLGCDVVDRTSTASSSPTPSTTANKNSHERRRRPAVPLEILQFSQSSDMNVDTDASDNNNKGLSPVTNQPSVFHSRLLQQSAPSDSPQRPLHDRNYLFVLGRGRARSTLGSQSAELPPFQPGLSAPNFIRLGRGCLNLKPAGGVEY